MTYFYKDPLIERVGPGLLRAFAIISAAAILAPALLALFGPLFA